MNLLNLIEKYVKMRKASSTKGGEWHGPCPFCGGNDRFHVWPDQNEGKGGFWCRACNRGGDAINFLREKEGLTYQEACAELNIHIDANAPRREYTPQEFQPRQCDDPAQQWQERAEKLIAWGQENLKKYPAVIDWLSSRGITQAAAEQYRLGWNPGENGKDMFRARSAWGLEEILKENGKPKMLIIPRGLIIPYIAGGIIQRVKIRRPEEHRTERWDLPYFVLPGSSQATMIIGTDRAAFVVVEAELDAIACVSAQPYAGAVAVGSSHAKPDAAAYAIIQGATQILNALDYDRAGSGAGKWWSDHCGDKCERRPVPQGKDPGEAYKMGTPLGEWIKRGVRPDIKVSIQTSGNKPHGTSAPPVPQRPQALDIDAIAAERGISPLVVELWQLLRRNPMVKIIKRKDGNFKFMKNGRLGIGENDNGGRIHDLVVREPDVFEFILGHEAEEIDGRNFIRM